MLDLFLSSWHWISGALVLLIDLMATSHVILFKRDVRAAIGWVGLIWFAPGIGSVFYYLFGINRIARKARRLKRDRIPRQLTDKKTRSHHSGDLPEGATHLAPLARLVHDLSGSPLLHGNVIHPLHTGTDAYREMIDAIQGAKRSIGLCTYIFSRDTAGRKFVDALGQAVARGVDVRVILDDVGSRNRWLLSAVGLLRRVGVKVVRFLPQFLPWHFAYANLRIHRKILVIDGEIGFTGGMNIQAGHDASLNPKNPIVDVHFRLDGPIVDHLRRTCADDWEFCTQEMLNGDVWFPHLLSRGKVSARGFTGGPDDMFERVRAVCLGALATARKSVRIVTPYFLPDGALIAGLDVAALRGVKVDIVLPSKSDLRLVQWACMGQIGQVLGHGCRVWMSPPPFNHSKLMIVDRAWVLFGSSNWDERSMRLNFEFDVESYDPMLAGSLDDTVSDTIDRSQPITLDRVNARRLPVKLRDGVCRLLSPYL